MKEQVFTVATPADFDSVIECILETKAAPDSQFTSPTNPTPPSVNHESRAAFLITLTGDLGAGKTTFTQQLAKHLGVTEHVTSPTFGIIKNYELVDHLDFDRLVHIDAYRIEDISEVGPLRLQETFDTTRTIICLEWPENIAEILPKEKVEVMIEIREGESRSVSVK